MNIEYFTGRLRNMDFGRVKGVEMQEMGPPDTETPSSLPTRAPCEYFTTFLGFSVSE